MLCACNAVSKGTVLLAQVAKISTWKKGFLSPLFQSRRSSYQFCSSIFKQFQLCILNFGSLMGAHLSVSMTFFSEVSFC